MAERCVVQAFRPGRHGRPKGPHYAITCYAITCGLLAVCGGCSGTTSPTAPATPGLTITITSAGVSPKTLTVAPGSQVTFVNSDTTFHDMGSDPHPEHTDCPEINQVGFLAAGQSRQTGNLNIIRSCGYHDHERPTNTALQGTIVIR